MTRLAGLLAFAAVLAACGGTAETSAREEGGGPAPLSLSSGPSGRLEAADGRSAFSLAGGELRRYSTATGERTRTYPLEGSWQLTSVSANGSWVALQRGDTEVLVLDAATGKEARRIELPGAFRVEAISAEGDFLFLQQDFVDGSYAVRGYDLVAARLLPGSLGRKGETVRMAGDPGQVVASPDGSWLLTVYVETTENVAFVHALSLIERRAICLPLPPCRRCGAEDWTLDLASDNRTLRATSGGGRRVVFDLARVL